MAAKWIEVLTGSLEEKKQYRQYKARAKALPAPYRTAIAGIERYLMYAGAISVGATLVQMLDDLATLFEQSAADRVPVRDVVGDDPVAFAEDFLANYADAQWVNKERRRLIETVETAEREQTEPER